MIMASASTNRAVALAAPLRKQVIQLLREAILSFEYKPGDRLVERDLCERCGVSRTVIREALRHLEAEGLVDIIPNHGPVVVRITPEDAESLYEVREVVEALVARRCAENATSQDRARLRRALKKVDSAYQGGELRAELSAKDDFYDALIAGAGNPVAASVLTTLHARTQMLRGLSLQVPGRADESLTELNALVDAVERGDGEAAHAIAADHVRRAGQTALDELAATEDAAQVGDASA